MGGCDEKIEAEITKANYVLRVVCNGMPLPASRGDPGRSRQPQHAQNWLIVRCVSARAGSPHCSQCWNSTTPPKHGSWLNIAEIEWAVQANRCPDRMPDETSLRKHVQANIKEHNAKAEPVKLRFSTQVARSKLARLYPSVSG